MSVAISGSGSGSTSVATAASTVATSSSTGAGVSTATGARVSWRGVIVGATATSSGSGVGVGVGAAAGRDSFRGVLAGAVATTSGAGVGVAFGAAAGCDSLRGLLTFATTGTSGSGWAGRHRSDDPPHQPSAVARFRRRALAFFQVLDGLLDDRPVDPPLAEGVARDQAVIADHVDDARDAARVLGDALDGPVFEQPEVASARDAQAVADVVPDLVARQRMDRAAQRDALLELAQTRQLELRLQLGLTDQHDLQQLLARGLEVRQQADLLENRGLEVLRLVEDHHALATGPPLLDEKGIEGDQALDPRAGLGVHAEVLQHVLEDLVEGERRVVDERDRRGARVELPQQGVQEGRLPGTHLAGEHEEPLVLLDAEDEVRERLPMTRRHEEELRVRRRIERLFVEAVESFEHAPLLTTFPAS